jgi:hypothetical protein
MRTYSIASIAGVVVMLLAGAVRLAAAQDRGNAGPTLKIGTHVMGIVWGPDYTPGAGIRVTMPLGRRVAFEVEVDSMGPSRDQPYADEVKWIYALQTRIRVVGRARTSAFATLGTTGWADLTTREIEQIPQPDGTIERRMGFKTAFAPPLLPTVGIAVRHVLARYVAIRGDAQLMIGIGDLRPVTGRVAVGLSVPIGAYQR